jgi:hypothetical protein
MPTICALSRFARDPRRSVASAPPAARRGCRTSRKPAREDGHAVLENGCVGATYEEFAKACPSRDGEFADTLNSLPKHVVSSTLERPASNNLSVLDGDLDVEVAKLKERAGPERREINWTGVYREVEPPERLVFTVSDRPDDERHELIVVVLTDLGGGRTEMRLEQHGAALARGIQAHRVRLIDLPRSDGRAPRQS